MLSLFIVDDEYYFRQSLKSLLPYDALGFYIGGEASNGQEGLERITLQKPDVVIADITMPMMDGLEMIAKVHEAGLNPKFVILTGYEEFQYARTAVRLGVDQYLIKPVDTDEFRSTLLKIRQELASEAQRRDYVQNLQYKVAELSPLIEAAFLTKLFGSEPPRTHAEAESSLRSLKLDAGDGPHLAVAIAAHQGGEPPQAGGDAQFYDCVRETLHDFFSCRFHYFCFCADSAVTAVFSGVTPEVRGGILKALKIAMEVLRGKKACGATAGVGDQFTDLSRCGQARKQALYAVRNSLLYGNPPILRFSDVAGRYLEGFILTTELKKRLLMALRTASDYDVTDLVQEIFDHFGKKPINIDVLNMKCSELLSVCGEFVKESNLEGFDIPSPEELLHELRTMDELRERVNALYLSAIRASQANRSSRATLIVDEIKKVVEANYQNPDFKVSQISNYLYLNYSHICHIFSQYTGTTISDHLTELRVIKAKELFDTGHTSVSFVSQKVGYNDANYFGKCYKKKYGVSPRKYCLLCEKRA